MTLDLDRAAPELTTALCDISSVSGDETTLATPSTRPARSSTRLRSYAPAEVEVDGLVYREGVNAVGIRGGIAGNVIPDTCVVTVNHRFAPSRTEAEAEAHLRELFDGFDEAVTDIAPGARAWTIRRRPRS